MPLQVYCVSTLAEHPGKGVKGWWAGVDSVWEQEKLEARKCSKMPHAVPPTQLCFGDSSAGGSPQRPVHALLGSNTCEGITDLLFSL